MNTRGVFFFVQPKAGGVELGIRGADMLLVTPTGTVQIPFPSLEAVKKALRNAGLDEELGEFGVRNDATEVTAEQLRALGFHVEDGAEF